MPDKSTVVFADENFYEKFIRLGYEVSDLEDICKVLGSIVATVGVKDSMQQKLSIVTDAANKILWETKMKMDNSNYFKLLRLHIKDEFVAFQQIEEIENTLKDWIRPLDRGAVSRVDINIFANAIWFGTHTNLTSLLISDDSDLLRIGHMVSSYFGLPLTILSIYEVLAIARQTDIITNYCKQHDLPDPYEMNITRKVKVTDFKASLSIFVRNTKISLHPTIGSNETIDSICPVKRK